MRALRKPKLLSTLTRRGKVFVALGVIAALLGVGIPEPDLLRIGALLILLPAASSFVGGRASYRLACTRGAQPVRIQAGQPVEVTLQLANVTRRSTGLLLAQDTLPAGLGASPRFVINRLRGGAKRPVRYQLRPGTRGKYTLGPLQMQVTDTFGLISISRSFSSVSTLTVTPRIVPLPRLAQAGTWLGHSDSGRGSAIASVGEDDVTPRAYRAGDALHRVHWRSTARHGELMVRREEQHWRVTASLFLDTRRSAFGAPSTFELAVTAAASVGVHLGQDGLDARLVTDGGEIPANGTFRDTLLDTLAVIRRSRASGLGPGIEALAMAGGQIIAVVGMLRSFEARQLAATRRGTALALALLLDTGNLAREEDTARTLTAAGWRVARVRDAESLAAAWQEVASPTAAWDSTGSGTPGSAGSGTAAAGTAATGTAREMADG
ncbi:MAG TPA: DUF58 domain-containing protein [Trebonia sp.]|jgi:uncharacterized protein (DUF58 family)